MSETSERVKTAHGHHPSSFLFPGNWCPGMWSASWMFWLVSRILTENSYITLGSKTVKGLHDRLYNSPNFIPFPSSLNHPSSQHTHTVSHTQTYNHTYSDIHTLSHTLTQSNALKHTYSDTNTQPHVFTHSHTHLFPDTPWPGHLHTLIQSSLHLQAPLLCPSHSLSEAHASSVTNLSDWLTSFGGGISELLFPKCKSNGFFLTFAPRAPFAKPISFCHTLRFYRNVCVFLCVCSTITRAFTNVNHATSLSAHLSTVSRAEYQQIHLEPLKNVKETAHAVS